jgi:hypothetical protein
MTQITWLIPDLAALEAVFSNARLHYVKAYDP